MKKYLDASVTLVIAQQNVKASDIYFKQYFIQNNIC